jgi:putative membrane protein
MRALTIAAALILVPIPAFAQFGNSGFLAPDTKMDAPGKPAPNQTNYTDRLFAQLVAAGGMAEVDLGKLAAGKTGQDKVKRFANRMVDDHSKGNDQLKSISEKSKIPLPDAPDPDHQKMRVDLEKLDGAPFDLAYLKAQVIDHQKTVQLLIWEIGQGQDADLQRFAKMTLPTVLEHLQMAKELQAELQQAQVARAQ